MKKLTALLSLLCLTGCVNPRIFTQDSDAEMNREADTVIRLRQQAKEQLEERKELTKP